MSTDQPVPGDVLEGTWATQPVLRTTKNGHVMESEDWVSPVRRFLKYYGETVMHYDAAGLVYARQIIEDIQTIINVTCAMELDRTGGYSARELGRILDMSHVAVLKRADKGRAWIQEQTTSLLEKVDLRSMRERELEAANVEDHRATVTPLRRAV